MPNYPLNDRIKQTITNQVDNLSQRALMYALADFPLTTATVQNIVTDPEILTLCYKLENLGWKMMRKTAHVHVAFFNQDLAEHKLRNTVVVNLMLPEGIYAPHDTSYFRDRTTPLADRTGAHRDGYLVADVSKLDEKEKHVLTTWLQRATRQQRIHEIAVSTTKEILHGEAPNFPSVQGLAPTVAHLQALWPTLGTLAGCERKTDWRARFRNSSKLTARFQPTRDTLTKYSKRILAADMVINAGQMLSPYEHPAGTIRASIAYWEPLPGDVRY